MPKDVERIPRSLEIPCPVCNARIGQECFKRWKDDDKRHSYEREAKSNRHTYRMWRRVKRVITEGGNSAETLGDWAPTQITFAARSQSEAQRKAEKFWRDAELGSGSMTCILEGTAP